MKKTYKINLKEEWASALDKSFEKKKKDANVPGFRKGHVTKEVYIKHYGIESLYMDAVDIAMQSGYKKLMEENDAIPVATPKVDIKNINKDEIELEYTIVTAPEVKLGKYKELGIKKDKVSVTKDEIDHELGHLQAKYVELKTKKDEKIENGNVATIDFEGFLDGKPFDGGKGEKYPLEIGSGSFIPGFEEQLIGMKVGEEKEIKVTFPKEYIEESLSGKEVTFKVKVHEVKEKITPKMDKAFFEDLAMEGVDSEESLRKEIKENIKVNKESEVNNKYINDCLKKVAENAKFEVPEEMIEDEIDRRINEISSQLQMQGFGLPQYLEMIRKTEEDLRNELKEEATDRVSFRLVLEQVAKDEKLEISDKDAEKEADKMAKTYNMKKEEFLNAFGGLDLVKYDMKMKKAMEIIQK